MEDKFLTLYCSISDTRRELQNALKNSKHNIKELPKIFVETFYGIFKNVGGISELSEKFTWKNEHAGRV